MAFTHIHYVYRILEHSWAIIRWKHYVSYCFNSVIEKSHLNDLFGVQSEVKISKNKMGNFFIPLVCNPGESRRNECFKDMSLKNILPFKREQLPSTTTVPTHTITTISWWCPLTHPCSVPVGHSTTWWSDPGLSLSREWFVSENTGRTDRQTWQKPSPRWH